MGFVHTLAAETARPLVKNSLSMKFVAPCSGTARISHSGHDDTCGLLAPLTVSRHGAQVVCRADPQSHIVRTSSKARLLVHGARGVGRGVKPKGAASRRGLRCEDALWHSEHPERRANRYQQKKARGSTSECEQKEYWMFG